MERLIGLGIGGFLVWLGYRLFLEVQAKPDSSGKFVLPGGTAIHLTRVGPGIFFSLFGTAIVFISFMQSVDTKYARWLPAGGRPAELATNLAVAATPPTPIETVTWHGANASGSEAPGALETARVQRGQQIAWLNRLDGQLRTDLSQRERNELDYVRTQIKLTLMQTVWAADWGDRPRFEDWINSGQTNVPADFLRAAAIFVQP